MIFHGTEGKEFASGERLSPEVERVLPFALKRIFEDVRALMEQPTG